MSDPAAEWRPSSEFVDVVLRSSLPALLIGVADGSIFAASPEAARLVGRPPESMVGRAVEEFTADEPAGEMSLVQSGRLSGFEANRMLRREGGGTEPLQVWIRAVESTAPVRLAIAIVWPAGRLARSYLPDPVAPDPLLVVGTVDGALQVERISADVAMLGLSSEAVVGASFFRLIDVTSAADVLHALAEAMQSGRALSLRVNLVVSGHASIAELMIRPLIPSPSFSFCLMLGRDEAALAPPADARGLHEMGRGLHALGVADWLAGIANSKVHGIDQLSTRELDITARLLSGDRVPAIAQALFLSQSTVRNHLSRVFRKLGVGSQQELIELFRDSAQHLHAEDTASIF